jgi:hypothetical protein
MGNPEILTPGGERGIESQAAAAERSKELLERNKESVENSPETKVERVEQARVEAQEALMGRESGGAEKRRTNLDATPSLPHASKKQRKNSYGNTMRQIQSEMTSSSRTFSKVIHNKTVERVSETVGASVARPNAVLAGSMMATFLTLFIFIVAKQYGYRLSGFETIGTFLLGWALGLIYDYARLMFAKRV